MYLPNDDRDIPNSIIPSPAHPLGVQERGHGWHVTTKKIIAPEHTGISTDLE